MACDRARLHVLLFGFFLHVLFPPLVLGETFLPRVPGAPGMSSVGLEGSSPDGSEEHGIVLGLGGVVLLS